MCGYPYDKFSEQEEKLKIKNEVDQMTFWTKVMEGRNGIDTINMALLFMVLLFNLITKLVCAHAGTVQNLLKAP